MASVVISGAESGGAIQASLAAVPIGYERRVERIVTSSTSSTTTTAKVYRGTTIADENLEDGTNNGDLDVSDNASPIRLDQGEVLTIRWTGASAASTAKARIQYVDVPLYPTGRATSPTKSRARAAMNRRGGF